MTSGATHLSASDEDEDQFVVDRSLYYRLHALYSSEFLPEKMKNNYLQKKMADYYTRRRMNHILKEAYFQSDNEERYHVQLNQLEELNDSCIPEMAAIKQQVVEMQKKKNEKAEQLKNLFKRMQTIEHEYGSSLSDKANMDKVFSPNFGM